MHDISRSGRPSSGEEIIEKIDDLIKKHPGTQTEKMSKILEVCHITYEDYKHHEFAC